MWWPRRARALHRPSLLEFFNTALRTGVVPQAWSEAIVAEIHKKGTMADPKNSRFFLLSMTYNLVAKILRKRLEAAIDAKLHTSQFGFRTSRSTAQAIHVARCLTESAERHGSTLYMQLLGWTQDFDKLHSQAVTQALTRHGVMPDFVDLVEAIVPAVAASRQNQPFFDLAYADDTAIFTGTAERGQQVLHTLREVAAHSNLSLNYKKSVLLRSSNVQSLPVPHRRADEASHTGQVSWSHAAVRLFE